MCQCSADEWARHEAGVQVRFAYADPPYIGCAKMYKDHEDYAGEVDHKALVDRLVSEFQDGWALSCHTPSLQYLLSLCPSSVRVLAWVKPFAVFKPNVGLAYAWEPVIFSGGRKRGREQSTARDWVSCNITLKKGLVGVKPRDFCMWLFNAFNIQEGDELVDMFPGSGAVTRHLESYMDMIRAHVEGEQSALNLEDVK